MVDPYWKYAVPPPEIGGSTPKPSFPGYLLSEASTLTTHHQWSSNDVRRSSEFLDNDILQSRPGAYGIDDVRGFHSEAGLGGLTGVSRIRGYLSPSRDPILQGQRPDVGSHIGPGIRETSYERPSSLRRADGLPLAPRDSNILFVDGLPPDCSRREVGHLFRPFIGFKELRVVHKGPRRSGDKPMVFCFAEFADATCAFTAMEALQGYKFDDKKSDSPVLKIHFAHFPFRPPSDQEVEQFGGLR